MAKEVGIMLSKEEIELLLRLLPGPNQIQLYPHHILPLMKKLEASLKFL